MDEEYSKKNENEGRKGKIRSNKAKEQKDREKKPRKIESNKNNKVQIITGKHMKSSKRRRNRKHKKGIK